MASTRWIVGAEDDGAPVAAILSRLTATRGELGDALAEGRVFVAGKRAAEGLAVHAGQLVEVWERRRLPKGAAAVSEAPADAVQALVLARDGEVVLAAKPPGLATEPERRGDDSLVARLAAALRVRAVHAASRLDVDVSGVVACSLGPRGAARLARAKERGELRRVYLAIASGDVEGAGVWEAPVGGKPATTRWSGGVKARDATWLELELVTGRTHQIREHAAGAGSPLVGDVSHDGPRRFAGRDGAVHEVGRPMLHATAAALLDRGPRPTLEATWPAPADMRATWLALDGAPTAWEGWVPPWRRPA